MNDNNMNTWKNFDLGKGLDSALNTLKIFKHTISNEKILNVLIVMSIPLGLDICSKLLVKLKNVIFVSRYIKKTNTNTNTNQILDERNDLLQKALRLYIAKIIKENPDLSNQIECDINFLAMQNNDLDTFNHSIPPYNNNNTNGKNAELNMFSKLQPAVIPTNHTWIKLKSCLWFRFIEKETETKTRHEENTYNTISKTVSYQFQAFAPNGVKRIDDFLLEAIEYYKSQLCKINVKGHYQYEISIYDDNNNEINNNMGSPFGGFGAPRNNRRSRSQRSSFSYTRFKLAEEKTFDTLFFREKQNLLSLLDHFINKTNKYAVKGYPHKLGLLLHGPPGTGKTSLIKAIAEYSKRNIVSINLSQVTTNKSLRDIIFNKSYDVPGKDFPVQMSFKDIVFVFEDIDAACSVVSTRDDDMKIKKIRRTKVHKNKTNDKEDKEEVEYVDDESDKLNLAGLLNVLDGTIDTPNRIIIMTTNHPENLDPALTRPGRIDKTIFLGYMFADQARLLLCHFFNENIDEIQYARLKTILGVGYVRTNNEEQLNDPSLFDCGTSNGRTPAQLEQMCAEFDNINDFIDALDPNYNENDSDIDLNISTNKINEFDKKKNNIDIQGHNGIDLNPNQSPNSFNTINPDINDINNIWNTKFSQANNVISKANLEMALGSSYMKESRFLAKRLISDSTNSFLNRRSISNII